MKTVIEFIWCCIGFFVGMLYASVLMGHSIFIIVSVLGLIAEVCVLIWELKNDNY
jgi:hypothetical protein